MIKIIEYAHINVIIKVIYCSNVDLISCSIYGKINIWNKNNILKLLLLIIIKIFIVFII